ncbi:MAG TPA: hypothetical protein VNW04_16205 [Puia sp.]|jgi:hypothetical protein|nr:hypothetical protein [Puia sp.]
MNQRKDIPGRYALFSSFKTWEMGRGATFYDQQAFADSQLERALDLRNSGFPIPALGIREMIKYYFFKSFRPFWIK